MQDASNNSTAANKSYLIPFCDGSSQVCLAETWQEYLLLGLDLLSLVANPIHIYVLTRFKQKLQTTYMKTLILITICDILVAATQIFRFNCAFRKSAANSYIISILTLSVLDSVNYNRFTVLSLAFFDRWLALAYPFKYTNSIFVERFKLVSSIPIGLVFALTLLRNVIFRNDMCIKEDKGISNCSTAATQAMSCSTFYTIAFIFDIVFLILLLRELRKMKQKSSLTAEDKELRNATNTVIVITLLYFVCFMWQPVIVFASTFPAVTPTVEYYCMYMTHVLYSLYGLVNIVVYGLMNESYRNKLKQILLRSNRRAVPA